ncbi:RagB/SusD family nutrient uptake outer membrane protein [Pedobacter glucosidilyticus]|uniref:RagB/SusD family nutrient uptake outer membrane protein n=1 Tax=Pedobacter glucosidilyticus TaxID=1122941 RepID=UPI00042054D2|nr:RagB/SusD family nutrient uptake outer membrane protein [Pedobacter glucosidilyticus]
MKKIKIIAVILLVLTLNACSDFLDTRPKDFVSPVNYYETEAQLNTALNAVYDPLGSSALYGDLMLGRMSLDGDEGYYTRVITAGPAIYSNAPSDNNITSFWQQCYNGINRANLLLENINKAQSINQVNKDAIEGEALFLRAYYHLLLVSNFGAVPLVLESLPNAENTDIPRTPAKQVYDKIIEDMTKAEGMVKPINVVGYGGKVNQSAVRGILARACLYAAGHPVNDMNRYVEARDWAKKVMDDAAAAHALNPNYSQIFINYAQDKYDIKESIWEIEFWGNRVDAYQEGGRVGANNGIRTDNEVLGYTYGFIATTGQLFRLYQINSDGSSPDLRRDWSIAPFSWSPASIKVPFTRTQVFERDCGKFRREFELLSPKNKNFTNQNFPILRYSDVLLMFAEAENQVNNGPTTAAYDAINQVRGRAYGKLLPGATNLTEANLSGLDKTTFQEAIQDERSRELSFECLRKSDLVRWNIFMFSMRRIAADFTANAPAARQFGATAFNNVTERDAVWPIPSRELGLNKLLTQNQGW